jgi:hypothetical protein
MFIKDNSFTITFDSVLIFLKKLFNFMKILINEYRVQPVIE